MPDSPGSGPDGLGTGLYSRAIGCNWQSIVADCPTTEPDSLSRVSPAASTGPADGGTEADWPRTTPSRNFKLDFSKKITRAS